MQLWGILSGISIIAVVGWFLLLRNKK
ncbi:hypothetical protein LD13_gp047 [Bacillus phage Bobb]|uniref:Uncharacterized protein n=1 Tax=Bacillus phage Bobb TaxID=1527469 RepID=A0A076G8N6_9CAUD|nr:hypothetical protein LD13_gp047 [Bacillus phage Bobb]AII27948.1 hypothetical protein [Bacillus phage Bobb]